MQLIQSSKMQQQQPERTPLSSPHSLPKIFICVLIFATATGATTLEWSSIPHLCDAVACPPDADIQCPEDSAIREDLSAVMHTAGLAIPPPLPLIAADGHNNLLNNDDNNSNNNINNGNDIGNSTEKQLTAYNTTMEVTQELYAQCCLAKKCICKTCNVPDCRADSDEVVVEIEPENMDLPGQCCGRYECLSEPNCAEVEETSYYWLQHCQRCRCRGGTRICQQVCDEVDENEKPNALCESKNLNRFFKEGDSWKDGCYECECVRGIQNCRVPFCGHVDCPSERQVTFKNSCCPVCWPDCVPMPDERRTGYDDGYGDYSVKIEPTGELLLSTSPPQPSPTPQPPQLPSATATVDEVNNISSSSRESGHATEPAMNVERLQPMTTCAEEQSISTQIYLGCIFFLIALNIGQSVWIWRMRAQQRRYAPVEKDEPKMKHYLVEQQSISA